MKFQGQAVLVYLEEDNITKAYFRIRPLLTSDGPVSQEELDAFPDEGHLRIVPDKNEQHTFKERMRNMCGLCLLDLRHQPADANKIRTNKNYNPSKGEMNQFIVYSDAVQPICPGLLYQVVSESDAEKAVTPEVYVRSGANMQGPVAKGQPAAGAQQLPPDSKGLYSVSVNGQELLFYWPAAEKQENASAPVAVPEEKAEPAEEAPATALDKIQQMNASCVSETTHKLQEEKPVPVYVPQQPQQPQQPLSGTRLYHPPQKQGSFRRAHNALMETVEQQRYAAKHEAPGAVVSDSGALKDVSNPVDTFKRCLADVCHNDESCRQAVGALLSCPGMRQAIVSAVSDTKKDLTVTAMHGQLQELEAERLMLLMQLDDARRNTAAYRQEAIGEMLAEEKAALDALAAEKTTLANEIEQQKTALSAIETALSNGCEALKDCIVDPSEIIFARKVGEPADKNILTENLETAYKKAGFICAPGDALAMLTAYALAPDAIFFNAETRSDALYAADIFAAALGTSVAAGYNSKLKLAPGGNTPVFVRGASPAGCTCVSTVFDPVFGTFSVAYPDNPMFTLSQNVNALPGKLPVFPAVSAASLKAAFVTDDKLSDETMAVLSSLRQVSNSAPVPLKALKNAVSFIASTQNSFNGGLAESIDRAVSIFLLPCFMASKVPSDALLPLIEAMPRSVKIWNEKNEH